jgi:hypothetical protein
MYPSLTPLSERVRDEQEYKQRVDEAVRRSQMAQGFGVWVGGWPTRPEQRVRRANYARALSNMLRAVASVIMLR